jgi:hypothetical protein
MPLQQYNFDQTIQDGLLACLIRYPEEFYAFGELLKPAYASGPAAMEVIRQMQEYRTKYGKYPGFTVLGNFAFHANTRKNIEQAKALLEYVEKLASTDTSEKSELHGLSIKFLKERALYDGIRKIHDAHTEGKADEIDEIAIMQDAIAVGTKIDNHGLSLYHDYRAIIETGTSTSYGVHTGYVEFDKLWKHGWAPGWLIVLLAPPKRFKSTLALNLATGIASQQDVDVLYYACEMSEEETACRAFRNITGLTQEQLEKEGVAGKTYKEMRKQKLWGDIRIKGYPSKSTSISEMKIHARHIITTYNLKPKAIVIDYAETVRPDSVDKKSPDWRQQADIYTQARAMGNEFGCCVIMPDRCNREAVDRPVPSMKSFQGAFEKAGIVDVAIGICATEQEHIKNKVRYFVFLNRYGEAHKHYEGTVDPERMKMTVDREIDYEPDNVDEGK